jgi:hypothetical protein
VADADAIVEWLDSDFTRIEKRFSGWITTPSSLEVRMAQEDLWVAEALLRIIQETNKGATSQEYAAVKRIEALEIGKTAAAAWAKAAPVTAKAAAGEEGGGTESPPAEGGGADGANAGAPAPGAMTKEIKELLDNRYVNEKGKPLAAGVRGPFPQYKMMPIHMRLLMSQDRLSHLLMECANSSMPVEVRLVKLSEVESGPGGSSRGSGGDDSDGGSARGKKPAVQSTDMIADIFGIISIFSQPPTSKAAADEAMSGSDASGQPAPADGTAPNPGNPQPADAPPPAENPQPTDTPPSPDNPAEPAPPSDTPPGN